MRSIYDTGKMAGGPGIEPGFTDPKSVVLPLDDPPTKEFHLTEAVLIQSRPLMNGCRANTRGRRRSNAGRRARRSAGGSSSFPPTGLRLRLR